MDRKTISAHELNQYAYCPYQWYYERLYGRKELRRRAQERRERLHLEDTLQSRFAEGARYHRRSYRRLKFRRLAWRLLVLLLAAAAFAGYWLVRYGNFL